MATQDMGPAVKREPVITPDKWEIFKWLFNRAILVMLVMCGVGVGFHVLELAFIGFGTVLAVLIFGFKLVMSNQSRSDQDGPELDHTGSFSTNRTTTARP